MSLDTFYIDRIREYKKGNMDTYNDLLVDLFGSELSWKEVQDLSRDDQRKLMIRLRDNIKIKESKLDINKLARAIQNSRSGIGGSALTQFKCNFCGEIETWGNTSVPNICKECSREMATNIVLMEYDLMKD